MLKATDMHKKPRVSPMKSNSRCSCISPNCKMEHPKKIVMGIDKAVSNETAVVCSKCQDYNLFQTQIVAFIHEIEVLNKRAATLRLFKAILFQTAFVITTSALSTALLVVFATAAILSL